MLWSKTTSFWREKENKKNKSHADRDQHHLAPSLAMKSPRQTSELREPRATIPSSRPPPRDDGGQSTSEQREGDRDHSSSSREARDERRTWQQWAWREGGDQVFLAMPFASSHFQRPVKAATKPSRPLVAMVVAVKKNGSPNGLL
ncbi:hypothetical protein ACOSP7_031074 [Xanthoceras sorbifolium]